MPLLDHVPPSIRDAAERTFWTFLQAFAAVFLVTPVAPFEAALIAGVAAALTVVKEIAKRRLAGGYQPKHAE